MYKYYKNIYTYIIYMYIYLYVYWRIFSKKSFSWGDFLPKKFFYGENFGGGDLRGEIVEHGELMIKSCQERRSAL